MKKIIIALVQIYILSIGVTLAQNTGNSLPETTTIIPYKLEVGFNTTTVIIFPVSLLPAADRGNREIIVQQEKAVDNILKIKAAKKEFQPTNLHAYTTDGKIYSFTVNYVEYPSRTTFNLANLQYDASSTTHLSLNSSIVDEHHLYDLAQKARQAKRFFAKKNIRHGIKLQLKTIHIVNEWLLFGFAIGNHSNLGLDIDFIRMYIRDKQRTNRSSIQEQELFPVFKDDLQTVDGWKENRIIIAVPKFTIPDNKEFVIELFERNGGRSINLKIKNRHLLRSKSF